jgi:RNA polymerase sigma-70 factor, ECF subfamily
MDETGLIAAARLGDQDAFAELYQQYIRYVRAIGRSILHTDDLDDFCQDTFLLAFTKLKGFEGNAHFRSWITRIAINRCLVILRDRGRPRNDESQVVQMDANLERHGFASIDAQLEGVPARLDLNRLLRVLSPGQRKVLELAYLEDMPDLEIAEALGTSLAAVKCRIYQAKRKVRNAQRGKHLSGGLESN